MVNEEQTIAAEDNSVEVPTSPDDNSAAQSIEEGKFVADFLSKFSATKKSKAKLRYSYSAANAAIFKDIFWRLYEGKKRLILCAKTMGLSPSTLYVKVNDALKYLCEVEDPQKWLPVRATLAMKKLEELKFGDNCGVLIYPRIHPELIMLNLERVKRYVESSGQKNLPRMEILNEVRPEDEVTTIVRDPTWKIAFHSWLQEDTGEVFVWPPDKVSTNAPPTVFTEEDKRYIEKCIEHFDGAELSFNVGKVLICK